VNRARTLLLPLLALLAAAAGAAGEPATPPEAAPPASAPAAAPEEATGKTVVEIRIEGLTTLAPSTVLQAMATRRGLAFHPATYREDFNRIYNLGHFDAHAIVLHPPQLTAAGVVIVVSCRERPVIDQVEVRGARSSRRIGMLNRAREDKTALTVGSRYDQSAAHRMAASLKAYLIEQRLTMSSVEHRLEEVPGRPGHVIAVFDVTEDARVYVREVLFPGAQGLTPKQMFKAISTKPGGFLRPAGKYDEDMLQLDAVRLQDLFHNNGYSDARVKVLPPEITGPLGLRRRRMAKVTFQVETGRLYTYGQVRFSGMESVSEDSARLEVYTALGVRPPRRGFSWGRPRRDAPLPPGLSPQGMAYSDEKVQTAAARIRILLGETGRPFPRVTARRERTATEGVVDLTFEVTEGPQASMGELRIKGNLRTKDRIIRREMELLPGDIFNAQALEKSKRNLRAAGLFERVQAHPMPGEEPDTVDIELEVAETETGRLQFSGAVYPEDGSLGGGVGINERNFDITRWPTSWDDLINGGAFRGGKQTIGANANFTTSGTFFSLNFSDPWLFDTPARWAFDTSLFHNNRHYDEYRDRRTGFNVGLGRSLFIRRIRLRGSYKLQSVYLDGMDQDLPQDILEDEGGMLLSSGELGLSFDWRDDRLNPTLGFLGEVSEEIFGGPFGGDVDFRKTSVSGHGFIPLFRTWEYPHVIHLYTRADWLHPFDATERIPVFERLFAGGIGTVRGYDSRSLSPRVDGVEVGGYFRLCENIEYIYPLYQDYLRGVVFFDAGNVWTDEGDFRLDQQRRSVGVGLHIRAPAAFGPMPIKLYFSKALNPSDEDDTEVFQMSFSLLF
jgi:outer membrane protein insertion porin family